MANKLLLIFDDDSIVNDVDEYLIFNNELDATEYFESLEWFLTFEIDVKNNLFKFKGKSWSGRGTVNWVKQIG